MSRYSYGGWAPYVPVATRRKQAAREVEKLRKKGQTVTPVLITGQSIATTFWGKAWCKNLESYHDYENRIPRGRTYVRNGSVLDLKIGAKEVLATVSGSSIYKVKVNIGALPQAVWQAICKDCSVGIDSLVELLQGRFNKGVMDRLCRQDNGLFPRPSEIKFSCSCPDYASMCKHIAAVLYGIGARLDEKPELLFLLRAVDHNDLLANLDTDVPLAKQGPEAGKLLETDDISQLFGLDMVEENIEDSGQKVPQREAKATDKTASDKVPKRRPATKTKQRSTKQKQNAQPVAKTTSKTTPAKASKRRPASKTNPPINQKQNAAQQEALYAKMSELVRAAGFSSAEEFLVSQKGTESRRGNKMKLPPRYHNPQDTSITWHGKGRKPNWVRSHLEGGGKLEDLEIS